jgi:hypothetical protein
VDGSVVLDVLREKKTQLVPRAGRTSPPGVSGPA